LSEKLTSHADRTTATEDGLAWQRQPSMLAQPGTAVDELGGLSQTNAPRLG